jgi:NADH:ubiquinone oxidoreductase subunit 4 (subunit M)
LPEVHTEVNSSISLFLAGLLLKLGILGILRFILCSGYLSLRCLGSYLFYSIPLIACLIVSCSCYRYFDIKKIIALSSILHLNLNIGSMGALNCIGVLCGIITSISHGFSSVGLFLFAGLLIQKIYSRYLDGFFFIDAIFRGFLLGFLLANVSFPGSLNFVGEIFALISIVQID